MKWILILSFLIVSISVIAQNHTPSAAGAAGLAIGGTRTLSQDVNAVLGNQAGLAFVDKTSLTVFGENRFVAANVSQFSAGAAIPLKSGTFGIAAQYFGFESYNEQKLGLAYARKLFDKVALAVQLDVLNMRVPFYGSQVNVTAEVGAQLPLNDKLLVGIHTFTPFTIAITEEDFVPTILAGGFAYQPSEKLTLTAEVEKDIDLPVDFKFGVDYQLLEILALRAGINTYPVQSSFGLGLDLKKLQIDVATVYHQILGVTTGFSVGYQFQ